MKFSIQKTNFWNRIAAALLDLILISIVIVGIGALISWITGYEQYSQIISDTKAKYEQEYGIKLSEITRYEENADIVTTRRVMYGNKHSGVNFSITAEDFEKLPTDQKAFYKGSDYAGDYQLMLDELNADPEYVTALDIVTRYDNANYAFNNDEEALYATSMAMSLILVIISLGFLGGYLVVDFIIPLIFKNGQTVGKKIFGIAVMHSNGVRINAQYLFIRTFIGKFTLETMIPVLLLLMLYFAHNAIAGIVIIAIALLEIILLIKSEYRQAIHDLLAKTVTVDIKSQQFFDNEEELTKFINQEAAERAEKSKYF